jgi:hypothetical protein
MFDLVASRGDHSAEPFSRMIIRTVELTGYAGMRSVFVLGCGCRLPGPVGAEI